MPLGPKIVRLANCSSEVRKVAGSNPARSTTISGAWPTSTSRLSESSPFTNPNRLMRFNRAPSLARTGDLQSLAVIACSAAMAFPCRHHSQTSFDLAQISLTKVADSGHNRLLSHSVGALLVLFAVIDVLLFHIGEAVRTRRDHVKTGILENDSR